MAIITEEPEQEIRLRKPKMEEIVSPDKNTKPRTGTSSEKPNSNNPFSFWFYFTISVSVITLLAVTFSSVSSSSSSDPRSFFLSLSAPLRHHYSRGRTIKVHLDQDQPPTEIFTVESGKKGSLTEKVVIVHGLGLSSFSFRKVIDILGSNDIHGVVFDLPGNGFSDKSTEVQEPRGNGVFERLFDVYSLVKEKGIFWAFDNMVETGEVPYEKIMAHYSTLKTVTKPIVLGSEEMGKVLGQVIGTMGLAPVHLVLHDSSLGMVANWVLENPTLVRSVTVVDTGSRPALPLWALEMPVVRDIVLGSNFAYQKLIEMCCSKGIGGLDLEAHRVILKGRDGTRAVVGTGKKLNSTFSLLEWGQLKVIKGLPIQVIWSNSCSEEWSEEGRKVAKALPHAKFVWHSGSRWSQEDAADELAKNIIKFVSSLPKSVRKDEEEPIPEHIQKLLNEAKEGGHHHGHGGHAHHHDDSHAQGHHHHGHGHLHTPGYMDGYGFGHGWGS